MRHKWNLQGSDQVTCIIQDGNVVWSAAVPRCEGKHAPSVFALHEYWIAVWNIELGKVSKAFANVFPSWSKLAWAKLKFENYRYVLFLSPQLPNFLAHELFYTWRYFWIWICISSAFMIHSQYTLMNKRTVYVTMYEHNEHSKYNFPIHLYIRFKFVLSAVKAKSVSNSLKRKNIMRSVNWAGRKGLLFYL